MSLSDLSDPSVVVSQGTRDAVKLSYTRTSNVLVEILHERARFHREPHATPLRVLQLIEDADRASLVRAAALLVAQIESMPTPTPESEAA